MIKTPLSTVIGGAGIWTPGCTVLGGQQNITQLIKSLFSNNEVGFAYDPNDLTTLYQDAAGTIPVTAAGQPVGLVLDKSKGLTLGSELFIESNVTLTFQSTRISTGYYNISSTADTSAVQPSIAGGTKWRVVEYEITRVGSGSIRIDYAVGVNIALPSTLGRRKLYIYGDRVNFVRNTMPTDIDFKIYSIKELAGNHTYQTTSSMRPLLVASPQRLDYDIADDKLITNLPSQLSGCTVIRSIPNVGTQILTNQTIPATYEDSTDHCGLIVINRALTTTETAQITRLFNKAAGV